MTNPTTVAQAMTEDVVTAEPGETLAAVAERMRAHRVGSAVVVERNHPVGIVTERDLLRATAAGAVPGTTTVDDWMAARPECVEPDRPIDQAWRQLAERGYRHIPVVVGDELKGIISIRDLMALAQLRPADEPPGVAPAGLKGVVVAETALGDVRGTEGFYHYRQYAAPDLAATRTFEDVVHLLIDGDLPTLAERAAFAAELAPLRHLPPDVLAALPAIASSVTTPVAALRTAISLLAGAEGFAASLDLDHAQLRADALRLTRRGADAHRGAAPAAQRRRADRTPGRPRVRRQLPLHDRRRRARPRPGPCHRAVPDPRHRPRLQRVDVRGPCGHLDRRRPRRGRGRRARLPVGPAARRRPQPGARHARRDRQPRPGRGVGARRGRAGATGSWASVTPSTGPPIPARSCSARSPRASAASWSSSPSRSRRPWRTRWPSSSPAASCTPTSSGTPPSSWSRCGLPRDLFTPTFAASRVVGWCAHALEQHADNRIIRPSSRYIGPPPPQPVPEI